ncbi:neoverrucotoxin subunit alpha-like [Labeo rohita]|uniref:neoverrucotoxin subunit alpha-like n=1 Tax=Labeo rohita TaxID=84645 RepID=UPI0021E21F02|nr:neoverrucotoxin subunit alpha-like [Labeo rohita]
MDYMFACECSFLNAASIEVAALGRPLVPGMLYDCRRDSFIPGVTLWDKKSLSEDLDSRPQPRTDLKFSSSDSFSSKSSFLDINASLKASLLGGLVEVGGSAKYLCDTKSSNQQSRVTMYYSETTRFEQLTMTQLGRITHPQVFEQKTATHVVTAVLYGAQVFMVFDRMFSDKENKQETEGELNVMVKKIPIFSVEGKGSGQMTDAEKEMAENITCTFHGDISLEQNPTTYMEALDLYKQLPTLLKDNPQNAVPIKVWLYPLHLLDNRAAQLEREISTSLVSITQDIMEQLEEAERTYNDLSRNTLVNVFRDIKVKLQSFQESFSIYKSVLQKALARVLPGIRGGEIEEKSLEDILKIYKNSPFNAGMLNRWLDDVKSEFSILSSYIKKLEGIKIEDEHSLNTILLDPDIDFVVCFSFTSLRNEDPYLEKLQGFLRSGKFEEQDGEENLVSMASVRKWFNDADVILKMRENLSLFRSFSEANKSEKRICFIISAISDPSFKGSSIYLYENGNLTDKRFQPVSKPPPLTLEDYQNTTVSLKLHKSATGETVQYRVEYRQVEADFEAEEQWLLIDTTDEDFTLTGLESGKPYLIRYRIVSKVGVSEASDTVPPQNENFVINPLPLSAQPVIVGGTAGSEVTFMTPSITTIKKIRIYRQRPEVISLILPFILPLPFPTSVLSGIQVIFKTGHMIKVGNTAGSEEREFLFDDDDKIIAATLWPTKDEYGLHGLEFEVAKNDGTTIKLSSNSGYQGKPVKVDVKSGKCYGITLRSTNRGCITALGFYFI